LSESLKTAHNFVLSACYALCAALRVPLAQFSAVALKICAAFFSNSPFSSPVLIFDHCAVVLLLFSSVFLSLPSTVLRSSYFAVLLLRPTSCVAVSDVV
jgi:hypothetical protein